MNRNKFIKLFGLGVGAVIVAPQLLAKGEELPLIIQNSPHIASFNRVLSGEEIAEIYNNGNPLTFSNGCWIHKADWDAEIAYQKQQKHKMRNTWSYIRRDYGKG